MEREREEIVDQRDGIEMQRRRSIRNDRFISSTIMRRRLSLTKRDDNLAELKISSRRQICRGQNYRTTTELIICQDNTIVS